MSMDRHNFLVGCIASVIALAVFMSLIVYANVSITRADRRRDEVRYIQCGTLPVPERVVCLER